MSARAVEMAPAPAARVKEDVKSILNLFWEKFREKYPEVAERYLRPDGRLFDEISGAEIGFDPELNAWIVKMKNYFAIFSRSIVKRFVVIDFLKDMAGLIPDRAVAIQQLLSMAEDALGG